MTDVCPPSHADGGDGFWFGDEVSPSVAGGVGDVVVGVEDNRERDADALSLPRARCAWPSLQPATHHAARRSRRRGQNGARRVGSRGDVLRSARQVAHPHQQGSVWARREPYPGGRVREAVHLLESGVASLGDIDKAITDGPGLRWGLMGPFLTYRLVGGAGGMAAFMRQFAPMQQKLWAELGTPVLDEPLQAEVVDARHLGAYGQIPCRVAVRQARRGRTDRGRRAGCAAWRHYVLKRARRTRRRSPPRLHAVDRDQHAEHRDPDEAYRQTQSEIDRLPEQDARQKRDAMLGFFKLDARNRECR